MGKDLRFYPVVSEGDGVWICGQPVELGRDRAIYSQLECSGLYDYRLRSAEDVMLSQAVSPSVKVVIEGQERSRDGYGAPLHHMLAADFEKVNWSPRMPVPHENEHRREQVRQILAELPPRSHVILYWS